MGRKTYTGRPAFGVDDRRQVSRPERGAGPRRARPGRRDSVAARVRRAGAGDEAAVPPLRRLLATGRELVETRGSLAVQARTTLIRTAAVTDLSHRKRPGPRWTNSGPAGPDAAPLERLPADRVALCRLSSRNAGAQLARPGT